MQTSGGWGGLRFSNMTGIKNISQFFKPFSVDSEGLKQDQQMRFYLEL